MKKAITHLKQNTKPGNKHSIQDHLVDVDQYVYKDHVIGAMKDYAKDYLSTYLQKAFEAGKVAQHNIEVSKTSGYEYKERIMKEIIFK